MLLSFNSFGQQIVDLCQDEQTTFTYYCTPRAQGWEINGNYISNQEYITITWDSLGFHTISASGECHIAQYTVNVLGCYIFFPSSFTPNGDGLNDFWKPEMYGVKDITWYIFDRWGLQLYKATGNDSWNGTYLGGPCQNDVYVWLAQWYYIKGGIHSQNGRVTISR